jgi:HPt (histidine-containing phosphotransfer) domain-containing protein
MTYDEKSNDATEEKGTPDAAMMRKAFEEFRASTGDCPRALAHLVGKVWSTLEHKIAFSGTQQELVLGSSSEEMLDITDLYHRMGDSAPRVGFILSAFAGFFHEQYVQLMESEELGDAESITAAAHALKGLLLEVGAKQPAVLAANIEQMCQAGQAAEARKLIPILGDQVILTARLVKHTVASLHVEEEPLYISESPQN